MPLTTSNPYQHDIFTVRQLGEHTVKITYLQTIREPDWEEDRLHKVKGSVNDEKLSNNLTRAKTTVKEYVLCNPWDYWCTFTIDRQKYDRYDLDGYMSDFSRFVLNYNRYCSEEFKVKYLLVPERHKDGAWHLHGFIKGIKPADLYVNQYGHLTWKQYESKFGFISMDKIKDIEKASSYVLKYMTKEIDKTVTGLHRHLYYCSKGLQKAVELYRGKAHYFGSWDWEHPEGYCKIKNLDLREDDICEFLEIY